MLERALRLLKARTEKGQRIVALTLRKNRIVGVGYNSYSKTHRWQRDLAKRVGQPKREYLHAEVAALLRSSVKPDTICVARISRRGALVNARPCPICALAISLTNPRMRIIHS